MIIIDSWTITSVLTGYSATYKKHDGKVMKETFWEDICRLTSVNGRERCEDICIPYKHSPKGDLSMGRCQ